MRSPFAREVEVDTTKSGLEFKTQLFSLTGVPPDRIKLMGLKGRGTGTFDHSEYAPPSW